MFRNESTIMCNLSHKYNWTYPDLFWTPFIVWELSVTISQPTLLFWIWVNFRLEICSSLIWCCSRFLDLLIMTASSLQRNRRGVSPSRLKNLHGEPNRKLEFSSALSTGTAFSGKLLFSLFLFFDNYELTFPSSSLPRAFLPALVHLHHFRIQVSRLELFF